MLRLKKLLLPVDYSPRCLATAEIVRLIASRSAVEVTVLHVTNERAESRADKEVMRAFSDRLSGINVDYREAAGDPAHHIVEYERSRQTDLTVMPTRAAGLLGRLLRGSVTERVLRGVECPVWTGNVRAEKPLRPRIESIACGIDLGPRSADVLRWAVGFAERLGASLTLVHSSEQSHEDTESRQSQLTGLLAKSGVQAEIQLVDGAPATAVAEAAENLAVDMLVIGRSRKEPGPRPDGLEIIRNAACWVVSVDPTAYPYQDHETSETAAGDTQRRDHTPPGRCGSESKSGDTEG